MSQPEKAAKKQAANAGTWRPGKSGNPAGRRPGTGRVAALRKSIEADLPAIIKAMVDRARDGDPTAARLLIERCIPALRPIEQATPLALPAGAGLTAQGAAIVDAMASGMLAPSQGAALLAGLGALARVKELDEIETRLRRLEGETDAG